MIVCMVHAEKTDLLAQWWNRIEEMSADGFCGIEVNDGNEMELWACKEEWGIAGNWWEAGRSVWDDGCGSYCWVVEEGTRESVVQLHFQRTTTINKYKKFFQHCDTIPLEACELLIFGLAKMVDTADCVTFDSLIDDAFHVWKDNREMIFARTPANLYAYKPTAHYLGCIFLFHVPSRGGCQKERENPIFWEFLFSFSFSFF